MATSVNFLLLNSGTYTGQPCRLTALTLKRTGLLYWLYIDCVPKFGETLSIGSPLLATAFLETLGFVGGHSNEGQDGYGLGSVQDQVCPCTWGIGWLRFNDLPQLRVEHIYLQRRVIPLSYLSQPL